MNKKNIRCLLLAVLLSFVSAGVFAGEYSALPSDSAGMVWNGDSVLHIRFSLVSGLSHRSCSDWRVTATPVVRDTAGNFLRLEPTVFAGKKNIRFNSRLLKLGLIDSVACATDIRDTVVYDTLLVLPKEMRLSCPALYVDRIEEGCTRSDTMPSDLILSLNCFESAEEVENTDVPENTDTVIYIFRELLDESGDPERNHKVQAAIIPLDQYRPFDPSIPLLADSQAVYIAYAFDDSNVDLELLDNKLRIAVIEDMINLLYVDSVRSVAKVRIIGSASVEGSVTHNLNLSKKRAEALQRLIADRFPMIDIDFEIIAAGEAWADFREAVANTDLKLLPNRNELLSIIDSDADLDEKEARLKNFDGGVSWKYLENNVLLQQRVAGFIKVYYNRQEKTNEKIKAYHILI